jgi:hypothetical protein
VPRLDSTRSAPSDWLRDSMHKRSGTAEGPASPLLRPPGLSVWIVTRNPADDELVFRDPVDLTPTHGYGRCGAKGRTAHCRARRYGSTSAVAETSQRGQIMMPTRPWSGGLPCSGHSPYWHRGKALQPCIDVAALSLAVLTLLVPAWSETPAGWDPDRHSGRAEWLVAVALMVCAGAVAGGAHRRPRAAATR